MDIYEKLIKPVLSNQVATGLSFTAALGMVAYQLRQIPAHLKFLAERNFTVQLRVSNSDTAFKWLEVWLSRQPYTQRSSSLVLKANDSDNDAFNSVDAAKIKAEYTMSPGSGKHWFFWRGRFIWIDREIGDKIPAQGVYQRKPSAPLETIWIYTIGRSQGILREIVEEARNITVQTETTAIKLWRGYWSTIAGKKIRDLDTVILKDGQLEEMFYIMHNFFQARPYYMQRGIPWRRSYLISGPPGTGKTSFVLALAAHLKRTICVLNLGSVDSDDALFSAMIEAPLDALILIEDVDCAQSSHIRKPSTPSALGEKEKDEEAKGITKAGLLNALDGVTTPDGRILIMTSNHPEMLDPALVRPGRADACYVFNYLGASEQEKMASLYFGKGNFIALPYNVSPAEMQKAFMLHPTDPVKARLALIEATHE